MTANRRPEGADELRKMVRERYTRVVQGRGAAESRCAGRVLRELRPIARKRPSPAG